jgi:hypothetical protein
MRLSDNDVCRKCGQEEESSYHILCQCPALAVHRMIFSSASVELIDIRRASIRQVLALAMRLSKDPSEYGHTVDPVVV